MNFRILYVNHFLNHHIDDMIQFRESNQTYENHSLTFLKVTGPCHYYIANETPMIMYSNIHNAIEGKRLNVSNSTTKEQGPRVMLVGPTDSGKTSISKILLSTTLSVIF